MDPSIEDSLVLTMLIVLQLGSSYQRDQSDNLLKSTVTAKPSLDREEFKRKKKVIAIIK